MKHGALLPAALTAMLEGPRHAYGLSKQLGWPRTSASYALLRAKRLGFARDVGPGCQTAGPPRKYIEITDEGRAYLGKR